MRVRSFRLLVVAAALLVPRLARADLDEYLFGEAVFERDGKRFTLSSQIRILEASPAKRWW